MQGHDPEVRSRTEIETLTEQMRYVGELIDKLKGNQEQSLAVAKRDGHLDEDVEEFIEAYSAANRLASVT